MMVRIRTNELAVIVCCHDDSGAELTPVVVQCGRINEPANVEAARSWAGRTYGGTWSARVALRWRTRGKMRRWLRDGQQWRGNGVMRRAPWWGGRADLVDVWRFRNP